MESVGERIRQVRISKGITQADLAAALDTTTAAISRYELSQRELRFEQVQAIANELGVSVFELYGFPSERQMWMENAKKTLVAVDKQIQHNLEMEQGPDEMQITLRVNEGLKLAAEEIERQLQDEMNTAVSMHWIQVRATQTTHSDITAETTKTQQTDPVSKQRSKRLDNLIRMFNQYPDDAQNRILEVVSTFECLTSAGQKRAVGRIKELAEIPRYQSNGAKQGDGS